MQSRVVRAAACMAAFAASASFSFYATAADLDYGRGYTPPPSVHYADPVAHNRWAGWYLGGVLGYGWGDTDITRNGRFGSSHDGMLGGGVVGWNWQEGRFVIGLEGDIVAADIGGSSRSGGRTLSHDIDWMTSLRARAGVSVMPNLLVYASIGANWADMDLRASGSGGGSVSRTFSGLQLGGGVEAGLTENWSARFDYLYTDFNSRTVTYPMGPVTFDPDLHQVRGSLVYRF